MRLAWNRDDVTLEPLRFVAPPDRELARTGRFWPDDPCPGPASRVWHASCAFGSEEAVDLRLLVLDGSRVLCSVVSRLAPEGVEVESVGTFTEASRRLRERPPEALMVNIGPTPLPWKELKQLCERHRPPIPVLYESCVYRDPAEAGIGKLSPRAHFLHKPYSIAQLRGEVEWLFHAAEELCQQAQAGETDAEVLGS